MKPILHSLARHPQTRLGLVLAAIALTQSAAPAATATWNQLTGGDASGSWASAANPPWSTGALPGASDTADFSTLNLTADSTVTLDGNQSINALIFGDTGTSSAANWILNPGTPGTSTLTLAGTTPVITVNAMGSGMSATIGAALQGTNGFTKAGAGTLNLSANSSSGFTGTLKMMGGTLAVNGGAGGSLSGNDLTFGQNSAWYDAGTLILDNANATGPTALSLGTLDACE